jgi:hypothetical protein
MRPTRCNGAGLVILNPTAFVSRPLGFGQDCSWLLLSRCRLDFSAVPKARSDDPLPSDGVHPCARILESGFGYASRGCRVALGEEALVV